MEIIWEVTRYGERILEQRKIFLELTLTAQNTSTNIPRSKRIMLPSLVHIGSATSMRTDGRTKLAHSA